MPMGKIQRMLYNRDLRGYPQTIPYENLSQFFAFKLQRQGYYYDITLKDLFKLYIYNPVKEKIRDYLCVKIITEEPKTYWEHKGPGMYSIWNKPCRTDCRYCKLIIYNAKIVSYKFKPIYFLSKLLRGLLC